MAKTIKLHKSAPAPTKKYRVQELVDDLPKSIKIQDLEKKLLDDHGITKHEFWSDRNIPYGSTTSIPGDRLMVYSKFFDLNSIDELMNHTIKVKPVIKSTVKSPLK